MDYRRRLGPPLQVLWYQRSCYQLKLLLLPHWPAWQRGYHDISNHTPTATWSLLAVSSSRTLVITAWGWVSLAISVSFACHSLVLSLPVGLSVVYDRLILHTAEGQCSRQDGWEKKMRVNNRNAKMKDGLRAIYQKISTLLYKRQKKGGRSGTEVSSAFETAITYTSNHIKAHAWKRFKKLMDPFLKRRWNCCFSTRCL